MSASRRPGPGARDCVLHGLLLVHVPLSTALLLLSITHAVVALRY